MNDPALVAAARRLRTAHIAYEAAHTAVHDATDVLRLAEHELTEAAREHRILRRARGAGWVKAYHVRPSVSGWGVYLSPGVPLCRCVRGSEASRQAG